MQHGHGNSGGSDPMVDHLFVAALAGVVVLVGPLAAIWGLAPDFLADMRAAFFADGPASTAATAAGWALIGLALAALVGTFVALEMPSASETTLSGVDVTDARGLSKLERKARKFSGDGVTLGGFTFSRQRETAHFGALGLPGSGKTVALNTILLQALDRREKVVIHDPKGDYSTWVQPQKPGRALLYAPWDQRSQTWAVGRDLATVAAIDEAARDFVPEPQGGGGSNAFFTKAGQAILSGLMSACLREHGTGWRFRHLAEKLGQSAERIAIDATEGKRDAAGFSPLESMISWGDSGLAKSATDSIATMLSEVQWIFQVAAVESTDQRRQFAVRDFVEAKRPDVLILKNDSRYQHAARAVFGAVVRVLQKEAGSARMPEKRPRDSGLWLLLDEFPQAGKEVGKSVRKLQEVGRSKGIRVIVAAQDESQFLAEYGRETGRVQGSMQQTMIFGRLASQTAKEVSERSGKKQVLLRHSNVSGPTPDQPHNYQRAVLEPEDFARLKTSKRGAELLVVVDGVPGKVTVPFPDLSAFPKRAAVIDNPRFESFINFGDKPKAEPEPAGDPPADKPEPKPEKPKAQAADDPDDWGF